MWSTPCSLDLISQISQLFNSVFLSQQINKQYFQPWPKRTGQLAEQLSTATEVRSSQSSSVIVQCKPPATTWFGRTLIRHKFFEDK
jgi:hypothetical protein